MPHEHEAYHIVDNIFISFIKNNRQWLNDMKVQSIVNVAEARKNKTMDICSLDVLDYPWRVVYVGKSEGGEGPFIVFMDENFNKLYSYYDVM
jgi:hypothetical protein